MQIAYCLAQQRRFRSMIDLESSLVMPIDGAFAEWAPALTDTFGARSLSFGPALPLNAVELLLPVERGSRIVIARANYTRHFQEFWLATPPNLLAFLKAFNALIGHADAIRYPERTEQLAYEIELVAVVDATSIERENPFESILGYTVGNDVSARDLRRSGPDGSGMDLFAAKSQYRTTGLGPWIVTWDELPEASLSDMHWNVATLISLMSRMMTLLPWRLAENRNTRGRWEGIPPAQNPSGWRHRQCRYRRNRHT